jgi:predicted phosphoribosyltransferase
MIFHIGYSDDMGSTNIIESTELRDQTRIFQDRKHAGQALAQMLERYRDSSATVFAIPAGGVPVAAEIGRELNLPLYAAVVSKITPPWNSEVGYGAVAFDGTMRLNEALVERLNISQEQVEQDIIETRKKVKRRSLSFQRDQALEALSGRPAILVDDGLASGFTMHVAVEALHKKSLSQVVVAVPTGPIDTVRRIAADVDRIYCLNIRSGITFAVADAYKHWCDVTEQEALDVFGRL